MSRFPVPFDEASRQTVLDSLGWPEFPAMPELDRVGRLAARRFDCPIGLVTLLDGSRQHIVARCGLDLDETPREDAFCAHAVLGDAAMVVPDATHDPRFRCNPLVTGLPKVRFYAGAPISLDGVRLGTLCLLDVAPRPDFSERDAEELREYARIATDYLALRRRSRDSLAALSEDLDAARDAARTGERAKAQFLALLNHELKTPLNAVIGFAECIAQELHGPIHPTRYQGYAEAIADGGRKQLSLIDRLLKLVDLGRVDLEARDVDITRLLRDTVGEMAGEAVLAKVALNPDLPDAPVRLQVDPEYVSQILRELIDNAVKFSRPDGRIRVSLALDERGAATVSVADDGVGMDEARVAEAIELFEQRGEVYSRAVGGVGLGLPLARKLARMHGAELRLRSRPGGGTLVELRFPSYRTLAAPAAGMRRAS